MEPAPPIPSQPSCGRICGLALGLMLLTGLLYWPTLRAEFLNWDDVAYVTDNDRVRGGLTGANIVWAFTHSYAANWHPLTWLSHMLDCQLYGLLPRGHHLTSVLFHAVNSALVLLVLHLLTGSVGRSALVAALFAWHPLHVESVAWVSERKDVLSAFFGLLTLMAYACYAKRCRNRTGLWYGLALLFFAAGLMSKPMLVTWPCVLLLLDFWPLARLPLANGFDRAAFWKLLREKIPFFALTAVSCVVTVIAQKKDFAVASLGHVPVPLRIANSAGAYLHYLEAFFWPQDLSPFHPLPSAISWPLLAVAFLVLGTVTFLAWRFRARLPFLLVGWLFFLGTLVPVIGLVQVGSQAYADRYTYLPLLGVMVAVIWLGAAAVKKWRWPLWLSVGGCGLLLAGLVWQTSRQIPVWQNTETLFRRALALYPDNIPSLNGLGGHLIRSGRTEEGVVLMERVLTLQPDLADARGAIADVRMAQGRYAEAVTDYQTILAAQPDHPKALNNFAWLQASCADPAFRNGPSAVKLAGRACDVTGWSKPLFLGTLAAALAEAGQAEAAVEMAERAARLAESMHLPEIAARNRQLQELYRQGKAAHGGPPGKK